MATIMSLPVELRKEIAFSLDDTTLLAFRQTTIDLSTASYNAFTERFFRRRSHVLSRHSLEVLRQISCSSLACHVQELRFIACPEAPEAIALFGDFPGLCRQYIQREIREQLPRLASENPDDLARIFKNFKKLNAANRYLECSADFEWMLLPSWKPRPIWAREIKAPPSFGVKSMIDTLGVRPSRGDLRPGNFDKLFRIVANALLQSGHTVASINLGASSWNKLDFIHSFYSFEQHELSKLFQKTKNLEVGIDNHEILESVDDWRTIIESGNLERLAIGCRDFYFGYNLAQSLADTSIVSIALCGMNTETFALSPFFSQLPRQVRSIELLDLDLNVADNWNEALGHLLAANLDRVVLRNLTNGERFARIYFTDQCGQYLHEAKGRREVTELLTRLIENGSCGHGPDFGVVPSYAMSTRIQQMSQDNHEQADPNRINDAGVE